MTTTPTPSILSTLNPVAFFTGPQTFAMKAAVAGAAALGALAVVLGLYWVVVGAPAHDRLVAAQATASAVVAKGDTAAAKDAAGVVAAQSTADASEDAQTGKNADAISHASGAGTAVDPGVALAGRLSLCRRKAYSHSPGCVALLKSNPG